MRRTALLLPLLVLLAPSSGQAADNDDRWIPAVAFEAGVRSVETQASISSIRGDIDGETRVFFGFMGLGAQLATPVLVKSSLEPRLFVRIGAAHTFDAEEKITNEGAAGEIVIPIRDNNGDGIPDSPTPVEAIQGVGSAVTAETLTPMWTAALGLDLVVQAFERRLHVKPSVEWTVQQDRVAAVLGYAEKFPLGVGNPDDCPCRTVSAGFSERELFNGIGPGLELELEATRLGPTIMTVFAGAQAYVNLNRKVEISGTALFDDGVTTTPLEAEYERDAVDYRVAWGVRVHWLPE